ncbi:MAG TPA: hypothetical protein VK961_21685 [Chthoniobacter sp.]|nr:hypothetical protein [Chthoniobacter sp.]
MNLEKVSAERDALVQALKRAEEELSRVRASQKQAEARLADSHVSRPVMIVPAKNNSSQVGLAQARAAQKRAEAMACTLEEQLQGQKAELEQLRAAMAGLKADNDQLREKIAEAEEQKGQQKQKEQTAAASSTHVNRNEVRSLRQELENSWAEIQRLRGLVVKVASEARGGTIPPALQNPPKADPRTSHAPRHTPLPTAPAKSKADLDTTPRSGVHRAA